MTYKEECKKKIIKDLKPFIITTVITAVLYIAAVIATLIIYPEIYAEAGAFNSIIAVIVVSILIPLFLGLEIAGCIVGWKWLSKYIRATNILGLCIKIGVATLIGYVMFPVILIKDIIAYNKA